MLSTLMRSGGFAATDDRALARDAYIWGLPLVQTRLYLKRARQNGIAFNQLYGAPRLSLPVDKVAGPNVDTLYGTGFLDLGKEPQILSVPDAHDRYYSIQLIDAYANTFRYVGRRATGTKAGHFAIVGPGWHGQLPPGVARIDSPTRHVLVLTRTFVVDDADLPAALAVQHGYSLAALSQYPGTVHPDQLHDSPLGFVPVLTPEDLGAGYFDELSAALAIDPPPKADQAFVKRLTALGIGPGQTPSKNATPKLRQILTEVPQSTAKELRGHFRDANDHVNGWRVRHGVTNFITDPTERASVNMYGPGIHVAQEALYFFADHTADGQPLSGARSYALKFPAGGLPPVDGFWSLTLYGTDLGLQENSLNRYAIRDRTAGLKKQADGSLVLHVQHEQPSEGPSNWLPAPVGPYQLCLRTYQPRPALIDGSYKVPPLEITPNA